MEERLKQQSDESQNVPLITTWDRAKYFVSAAATVGGTIELLGGGGMSLVFGAGAGALAAYLSPEIRSFLIDHMPAPGGVNTRRSKLAWLLTGQVEEQELTSESRELAQFQSDWQAAQANAAQIHSHEKNESIVDDDLQSLAEMIRQSDGTLPGPCAFSVTLRTFMPTRDKIFLGYLPGGTAVFVPLDSLCHVALAGLTGNGKTTLIRLLVSQLLYVGAKVMILNPHYTSYDIKKHEDWTPIERHLYRPPVTEFAEVGSVMKWAATKLLRDRLEKYRQSIPWGDPIFLVIDELPAIVKHVPEFPEYISAILREGRKVDIFLMVAAQDFLVRTVGPDEGGAVRKNYKTKMYVGGDITTAKTLLDMPPSQIKEDELGEGIIMMRNQVVKKASLARVPYVDTPALERLLGPSTYQPTIQRSSLEDDDLDLEEMSFQSVPEPRAATQPATQEHTTRRRVATSGYEANQRRKAQETAIRREWHSIRKEAPANEPRQAQAKQDEPTPIASEREISLQEAFRLWSSGSDSVRDLAKALDITPYQANKLYTAMVEARMIEPKRKVVVRD